MLFAGGYFLSLWSLLEMWKGSMWEQGSLLQPLWAPSCFPWGAAQEGILQILCGQKRSRAKDIPALQGRASSADFPGALRNYSPFFFLSSKPCISSLTLKSFFSPGEWMNVGFEGVTFVSALQIFGGCQWDFKMCPERKEAECGKTSVVAPQKCREYRIKDSQNLAWKGP